MATLILGAAGAAIGGSIGGADPWRECRHHRRLHRLHHRLGRRQLDHLVAGAHAAHRGRAARHAAHHLGHRRRGHPAALRPDADGRQHHLGDRFPRGDEDHHAGRRQGRRGRQGQDHRVSLLRQLRRRLVRGPDHRHRPHLGRRQADGPLRRHLALVSGRRGADGRSVHRREDGRGQHARLSRHGLCGLRGTGALDLWQPPAAALLRGVPAARRSRHRRGADPRRHHDPGLGRVHLRDAGDPQDRWRRDGAREPERAGRLHRHGGGARPAAGHGARRSRASASSSPGSATICARDPARCGRASRCRPSRPRPPAGRSTASAAPAPSSSAATIRIAPSMAARRPTSPWCRRSRR